MLLLVGTRIWVDALEGTFSLVHKPLDIIYTVYRKGLLFKNGLSSKDNVWGQKNVVKYDSLEIYSYTHTYTLHHHKKIV